MQFFLSSVTLALVACAAVDSASKSVSKRDLWQSGAVQDHPGFMGQSYSGYLRHSGPGVQDYGNGWSQGIEARMHMPEAYQYGHMQAPVHPVHEYHDEESQGKKDFQEWKPVYSDLKQHAAASHTKNEEQDQHSHEEWRDDEDKHEDLDKHQDSEKHHHHHHHHHVKVIEVPKPYTVHVEKPYPVYVEKPIIVEKHVPLKLLIKKKYH